MTTDQPLFVDGSTGEGGGQVLRTALGLSLVTGRPFRMERIRAGRARPGLARQHRTAVRAAARVGAAEVEGDALGSTELSFSPSTVEPGRYRFSTEGAGSTVLVLQAVLPALLEAGGTTELVLEGGTHNPFAPPFDFLERSCAPLVERLGPELRLELERPGFHPAGGGRFRAVIQPTEEPGSLELLERGAILDQRARAYVSDLPRHIAERELSVAHAFLSLRTDALEVMEVEEPRGPGNALVIEVACEHLTAVFTGFGEKGRPAEEVALATCREVDAYLEHGAPVGRHLADQLLVPLAVAGGGRFRTTEPSSHTRTNAEVIRRFLGVSVELTELDGGTWEIRVPAGG